MIEALINRSWIRQHLSKKGGGGENVVLYADAVYNDGCFRKMSDDVDGAVAAEREGGSSHDRNSTSGESSCTLLLIYSTIDPRKTWKSR